MKKIVKLLLGLIMVFSFSGCSKNEVETIALDKENKFGELFSYQIESINQTKELTPDVIKGGYTYFQPSKDGNVLLDVVTLITNSSDQNFDLEKEVTSSLIIDETEYKGVIKTLSEDGSAFKDNIIKAKTTDKVHIYVELEPKLLKKAMKFKLTSLKDDEKEQVLDFKLKDVAKKYESKKIGDTLKLAQSEIGLQGINAVDKLEPVKPSGLYNYYQASQGNQLVVVTTTFKNIASSEQVVTNMATIKLLDKDNLEHPGYLIVQNDRQSDLASASEVTLASNQTKTVYLVFEVSSDLAKASKTIKISNNGKVYTLKG